MDGPTAMPSEYAASFTHVDRAPFLWRNHRGAGQSGVGFEVGLSVRSDRLVGLGVASIRTGEGVSAGGGVTVGEAVTGEAVEAHSSSGFQGTDAQHSSTDE